MIVLVGLDEVVFFRVQLQTSILQELSDYELFSILLLFSGCPLHFR
jgi:hypothetical protein